MLDPIIGPRIRPIPLVASNMEIADSIFSLSGEMSDANEYEEVFNMADASPIRS